MRYSGGKEMIAGRVAAVLQPFVDEVGVYCEPFLGGASVFSRVRAPVKYGSDSNPWLMLMWRAILRGWVPPDHVSEEYYAELKAHKPMEPVTAFAGFACSFGGKWFGGFARGGNRNFAAESSRGIARKAAGFGNCVLATGDYENMPLPSPAVIYCDPPYAGMTNGYGTGRFDTDSFWRRVRHAEARGFRVFVSEYTAPDDFEVVAAFPKKVTMNRVNEYVDKGEKLFRWKGAL